MDGIVEMIVVVLAVIGVFVMAAGIGLLMAFPIMWCWNYAVVAIWGFPISLGVWHGAFPSFQAASSSQH